MKVLIAEGNKVIRNFIREIISNPDCEICEVSDGRSAIESYNSYEPDIVLIDLGNNIIDGIELIKIIRKKSSHVKIIATAMSRDLKLFEMAKYAGADEFLNKENLFMLGSFLKLTNKKDRKNCSG